MYWPIGHGCGRFRGFRAVALVLVLSLLMSFGWSALHAAANPPSLPAAEGGRTGYGEPVLASGDMTLADACLPRQPGIETARQVVPAPPDPQPASLLDALLSAPAWSCRADMPAPAMSARSSGSVSWDPRVPTGPPSL
jgi:hypothetical protein